MAPDRSQPGQATGRIDPPAVTLRIPGHWPAPEAFADALPDHCAVDGDQLVLNDGSRFDLGACPADDEFFDIFITGCTRKPSDEEIAGVRDYTVNVLITGEGGSIEAAGRMLRAGAAALVAGGFGVFVDNSAIAHGRDDWLDLAADETDDGGGAFWGFVMVFGDARRVWSRGMAVLGYRDASMPRSDDEEMDDLLLRNFLAYAYRSGRTIHDGDLLTQGPLGDLRAHLARDTKAPVGSPLHNPYGLYRLETPDTRAPGPG